MTAAVEARDLFRVFSTPEGDAAALQGLSLAVREREVVVVLGPSGSGKTTFLRVLAGLERPSAGTARVFGLDVAHASGRRLAEYRARTLGYADQHYARALAPELTARESVALRLGLAGMERRARLARADELLERVGLGGRGGARPRELSGGEQQRVAVCSALAHRPRLLLADEPTAELDEANAAGIYELIGELSREAGCTTVLVTHDAASTAIADRVVKIRDGRVSEESSRDGGGADALVVARGGWLRLPEELLQRAGIGAHAAARFDEGRIVIERRGEAAPASPQEPVISPAAAEGGIVAEAVGVAKTHGAEHALEPVTARFARGRLTAVTGPSGSGKTTFLHVLAGLELPSAGEVTILGQPLGTLDREARAALRREHVGVVRQAPGLVPFLGARENVELGLALRGTDAAGAREAALDVLAAVGLAERAEQRVERLSTGERARVALARALAARPALLLADEPTARLDAANALAVAVLLAHLARDLGTAVVCATHDPLVIEQADEEIALGKTLGTARP